MNSDIDNKLMDYDERKVADKVADEILEKDEKEDRKLLILLLIFLFCLIFLISSVTFALIGTNYNDDNAISTGSVLFSYVENSNNIEITNAMPISDKEGLALNKNKEYFEFYIAVGFNKVKNKSINYELSLYPNPTNTLDGKYVRVALFENDKLLSINNKTVNNFSDLSDSKTRAGSKLLIKRTYSENKLNTYVLKMWLSSNYSVDNVQRTFRCRLGVDAY